VTIRQTPLPAAARPPLRRRLGFLLGTLLTVATLVAAAPAPAAAATANATETPGDVAAMLLGSMNADRVAGGLVGYRTWAGLDALAADRASRMAAAHTLSHAFAGDIGDALDAAGIGWMGYGEVIAMSGYPWGTEAATNTYGMWWNSPPHKAIMMSDTYNYVGIGVAQADDGSTWVSAVMTESLDHTAPVASNRSISVRSRDDIVFRWSGADPLLQTHTAGVRTYDVLMRRDRGTWRLVRDNTTATALVLRDRLHGHWFTFRVQARDGRGNLSAWTSGIRIWVP
jgi:uncharacterized protein YkwD